MKRRFVRAILVVTALTVVLLGLPLAVVVHRSYVDRGTIDLQRVAAEAAVVVAVDPDTGRVDTQLDPGDDVGVYDASGTLIAGNGPAQADAAVRAALAGRATFDHRTEDLVYAVPITVPGTARTGAAVRVAEHDAEVDAKVHRAWLIMAVVGAFALLIAWLVAIVQARRLAEPIQRLARSAEQLGDGGIVVAPGPTSVRELDLLGDALASSSARVAEALARERAFSADVSHQLRTPLTGLRVLLESEHTAVTDEALAEVDRLQQTIDHLLALFARDHGPTDATADLGDIVRDAGRRWAGPLDAHGRGIEATIDDHVAPVRASATALTQIVDVLVDNTLTHGHGTVRVVARSAPGGAAVDVSDEGPGIAITEADAIFRRRHGSGHGIGLALARSLSEADGGRLILSALSPPRFTLLLPAAPSGSRVDPTLLPADRRPTPSSR